MPIVDFPTDHNRRNSAPQIESSAWIAPDAWVIGDVTIGARSVVLFTSVIRGDVMPIVIGEETNIQDGSVLHSSTELIPLIIGSRVTVGHRAILHGCTVEDEALIGMGATVLDQAVIGAGSIIGANALVTQRTVIPPRSLVLGSPARVVRTITDKELAATLIGVNHYVKTGIEYRKLISR